MTQDSDKKPRAKSSDDYTVCEYFSQGENSIQCEECGARIDEYDLGYGTVFYSIGPESVCWSIGDGAIICPDCIRDDKYKAVKPLVYEIDDKG